jgi:hypothetical protein
MELKTIQIIPENLFLIDDFETDANKDVFNAIVEAINATDHKDSSQDNQPTKKVST